MNYAIKLGRINSQQSHKFPSSYSLSCLSSRNRAGCVRFAHVASGNDPKQSNIHNMDKSTKSSDQDDKNLNVMEESFGKGYSTRSDDEGFGGVYGGNDECNTDKKIIQDPAQHDSTQGSVVKEKEHARNQKN